MFSQNSIAEYYSLKHFAQLFFIQSEKLFASKAKDLDLANGKLRAYP